MNAAHRTRGTRRVPLLLILLGLVLVASAGTWQLRADLWMRHYHQAGASLIQQEEARIAAAQHGTSPSGASAQLTSSGGGGSKSCNSHTTSGPQALLQLPSIGVVAPIEQGSGDPVLAVAVGHDPYSVWPGTAGTSVLLSHDVTYFVNISHLKVGQLATYVTPCASYTYKVAGSRIVVAGSPIYNSPASTIALITCWPTNALFYTNQRYVVTLNLVKTTPIAKAQPIVVDTGGVPTADARVPSVPVPAVLAAEGLSLSQNYVPMGVMTILGTPNARYAQSPAALLAEEAGLTAYFGGLKALAQGHTDWWKRFAPGVAAPASLIGHSVTSYSSQMNVFIEARGNTIAGVILKVTAVIGKATLPIQVSTSISAHDVLTITSWSM